MTVELRSSIDLSFIDSISAEAAYSPDDVAFMAECLAQVCRHAAHHIILNDGLRTLLASAILEGVSLGLREADQINAFALRPLPAFRQGGTSSSEHRMKKPAPPKESGRIYREGRIVSVHLCTDEGYVLIGHPIQ